MAQIDQDLFRRMQEAALRFRSGESDREEIMTPNGPAVLVRDPTNSLGFRIDFVGGGSRHSVSIQEYPAAAGRPHGWPAPMPFLAHCRATINTLDQAVTWHDVPDLDAAAALVREQCLADDWTSSESDGDRFSFAKDDVRRTLTVNREDASLTLHEKRPTQKPKGMKLPSV
jgi:hypothetical protein